MAKRNIKKILFWFLIISLPAWFILFDLIVYVFFPFHIVFNTCFLVKNKTEHTIFFSPVGRVSNNDYYVLPQYAIPCFGIPSLKQANHKLKPGQIKMICYNWDDISFDLFYIRAENGEEKELFIGEPRTISYRPPKNRFMDIENIDGLGEPHKKTIDAIRNVRKFNADDKRKIYRFWFAFAFVVSWLSALIVVLYLKWTKTDTQPNLDQHTVSE